MSLAARPPAQPATNKEKSAAKEEGRAQDRKAFLRAVLRDEMLARMDAEGKRDALESDTNLMGARHIVDYNAERRAAGDLRTMDPSARLAARGPQDVATVQEQYEEVMDELGYVAGQPVGSKFNVIRLHYLVEEENRLTRLRRKEATAEKKDSVQRI